MADGLGPAEDLFDALADPLADLVAGFGDGFVADRAAAVRADVLGDVRLDSQGLKVAHKPFGVIAFVRAQGVPRPKVAPAHLERGLALRRAGGHGGFGIHNQAMAVLHQGVRHETELGLLAFALAVQPSIGVGRRGVGVVAPPLALEIDLNATAAAWLPVIVRAGLRLGAEALLRCPSLYQRAVNAEMFVGHQAVAFRDRHHPAKKVPRHRLGQQASPVLGKGRVGPTRPHPCSGRQTSGTAG